MNLRESKREELNRMGKAKKLHFPPTMVNLMGFATFVLNKAINNLNVLRRRKTV